MGVKRAKLYYTRTKSTKEIDKIYSRTVSRERAKTQKVTKTPKAKK